MIKNSNREQNVCNSRKKKIINVFVWSAFFLVIWILFGIALFLDKKTDIHIEDFLFTVTSPLQGTAGSILTNGARWVIPRILPILLAFAGYCVFYLFTKSGRTIHIHFLKKERKVDFFALLAVGLLFAFAVGTALTYDKALGVRKYLVKKLAYNKIYENYYVTPDISELNAEKTKNLIYIYLESMENTYMDEENGGFLQDNLIPHLTDYAKEGISFSSNNDLGGFDYCTGTSWTFSALMSSTSGIHWGYKVATDAFGYMDLASNLITLGDILEEKGYNQEFLCGSDAHFAGRDNYFRKHGNYKIMDYYAAIDAGYIPSDYYEFWGLEDRKLFDIAKKELEELAASEKPFNFTLLTVDTHYDEGYRCELCEDEYDATLLNAIKCSDNRVHEFIEWVKEQPFYEDTVIVISGDHLFMTELPIENYQSFDRKVYNCILNSETEVKGEIKNRTFTSLDMFPTTLSALGFTIPGDRLGLGTDMFSGKATLAEELGIDYLNEELAKNSHFYDDRFN